MSNNSESKKVVLIGANGFIGSYLWPYIVSNFRVSLTIISRNFSEENRRLAKQLRVRLIKGDYQDLLGLTPVLAGSDLVYHLASSSFPTSSWDNPIPDIEQNLLPSVALFDQCGRLGVKKVVFISSGGSIYGKNHEVLSEDDIQKPFSPHGIIKLSIEHFLEYFRIKQGLNYDIYRLSNTYGPGQNKIGFGVINTWLRRAAAGESIVIYGDGQAKKDFLFVEDAVGMISYSLHADIDKSEVFNINSGIETSLEEILNTIKKLAPDVQVEYKRGMLSDNKIVRLSNKKILEKLNGFKFTSLTEGISKTWASIIRD